MRTHLYSALGTLKLGMDILLDKENVKLDRMFGHGGLFKTKDVGQKFMAAAINTPVSLMETAGEERCVGYRIACVIYACKIRKRNTYRFP